MQAIRLTKNPMLKNINSILNSKLKRFKQKGKNRGFTLIELLAAMILASLIITPLLGFMINILDTDRKEQAKISSEQEIQTAIDYIAQDLQQAIYIYDAKGVDEIKRELPEKSDRVPVLVFWKREFEEEVLNIRNSRTRRQSNDTFVYSLVAYYLIQSDKRNNRDETWSKQFRIARFELKDGIRNPANPGSERSPNYLRGYEPDDGFALFKLNDPQITGTLEDKMNAWENDGTPDSDMDVLIDYVDASQENYPEPVECDTVFNLDKYPEDKKSEKEAALKVPAFEKKFSYSSSANLKKLGNGSFYACVDIDTVSAKIFLRGNGFARINDRDKDYEKSIKNTGYAESRKSYFPSTSVQVKGRGLIGVE